MRANQRCVDRGRDEFRGSYLYLCGRGLSDSRGPAAGRAWKRGARARANGPGPQGNDRKNVEMEKRPAAPDCTASSLARLGSSSGTGNRISASRGYAVYRKSVLEGYSDFIRRE